MTAKRLFVVMALFVSRRWVMCATGGFAICTRTGRGGHSGGNLLRETSAKGRPTVAINRCRMKNITQRIRLSGALLPVSLAGSGPSRRRPDSARLAGPLAVGLALAEAHRDLRTSV